MYLTAQEQTARHGHIGKRKDESTQDGKEHGERHGTEHLSLDTDKRHQRNVHDHDDNLTKSCTLSDTRGGIMHLCIHLCLGKGETTSCRMSGYIGSTHTRLREIAPVDMCHHSLDDDNRRIDYHSEVDGSQTHQVAIHTEGFHQSKGKEHTQRNDTRHYQTGTPVAQEENQYEDDNESACYQVVGNGSLHSLHQVGAVDKGFYHHTFGQRLLYLIDTLLHVLDDLLEVLTLQHDGDTCHHFTLAVSCHGSETGGVSFLHFCHILDSDRSSFYCLDGDVGNIVERFYHTQSTDVILIGVLLDITSAGIGIVALQGIKQVADSKTVGIQLVCVYSHLILLDVASPSADLCHTWRSCQLLAYYPVLNGAQLGERIAVLITFLGSYCIVEYLAQTCSYRP